jgi:SAM-dependent methyltransferase
MHADYGEQQRGSGEAYARYLASMDASMRQKVALTAAHFLCRGRVADMGMGSGSGTHAIAALYPDLEVVGVDVDERMVALARERYRLPNLRFVQGDVAAPVFADGSLDGILDSSVLHHVTSFGGYRHEAASEAIATQVRALKVHGVLVIRDFIAPEDGDTQVLLDLRCDDGDDSDDPRTCSSATLLARFAREFRTLSSAPGFPLLEERPTRDRWRRFRLAHRHAVEFVLRKDYRADWVQEVKEEYTWSTQRGCERLFATLGLRLLASTPISNPWIVANRWEGKVELRDLTGRPIELPPTNYVIAGERVAPGDGVRFRVTRSSSSPEFLELTHAAHRSSGKVMDLVRRPHLTIDVVPHFEAGGETFVLAKMSYPRPLLATAEASPLDGSTPATYVTEPLNALQESLPFGETVERVLARFGVPSARIRRFRAGGTYYPSPGGIQEEVRSVLVEIEPTFVEERVENRTGFSGAGRGRAIEARQVLRAAQVGGLADARLELNVYELFLSAGIDPGPWIGEEITLEEGERVHTTTLAELASRTPRRVFERAEAGRTAGFLSLDAYDVEEVDAAGARVGYRVLEAVAPSSLSCVTVATALLRRDSSGVYLGIDDDDLPAAQGFTGHSSLLVAPAWRLPRSACAPAAARQFIVERLAADYGARAGRVHALGGRYYPTPGATPEVVHPWAVEIQSDRGTPTQLRWVPIEDVVTNRAVLLDGHLRIVALRGAHALHALATKHRGVR